MTVWDGGGTDTYDFSNYTTNLTVNLSPGEWTTTSATQLANLTGSTVAVGNIANALLYNGNVASLIENAIGGSGHDTIIGNVADNSLTGGAGNDSIDGGSRDRHGELLGSLRELSARPQCERHLDHHGSARRQPGWNGYTDECRMGTVQRYVGLARGDCQPANRSGTDHRVVFERQPAFAGDRITNDNTLTLSGTAAASSTVHVYDGATLLGTTTADANGAWTFDTAALADGVHTLTATATDGDGNTSAASALLSVTVDCGQPHHADHHRLFPRQPRQRGWVHQRQDADPVRHGGRQQPGACVRRCDIAGYDDREWRRAVEFHTFDPAAGQVAFACGCAACGAGTIQSPQAPQSGDGVSGTLSDGVHVFTAIAADAAGNTSAASAALERDHRHGGAGRAHRSRRGRPTAASPATASPTTTRSRFTGTAAGQQHGPDLRRRDAARHGDGRRQRRLELHHRRAGGRGPQPDRDGDRCRRQRQRSLRGAERDRSIPRRRLRR